MAKETFTGVGKTYTGTPNADTYTVKGKKNTVRGAKNNDTIILSSGTGHKFYGDAGNDTFVIGKKATGSAVVKDYSTKSGNKDKLKVSGGVVKSIVLSGKNLKFTGGKSATVTLNNTKAKTVAVTDSRGSYTIALTAAEPLITLGKDFKGTMNIGNYLTTVKGLVIDARNVKNTVDLIGNKNDNGFYVGTIDGGTCQGMAGDDIVLVSGGNNHIIYGDDKANKLTGKDTLMVQAGSNHTIYGGKGDDTIYLMGGAGDGSKLKGGAGKDQIAIERDAGTNHYIEGGAGVDTISIDSGKNEIHGGTSGDIIKIGANLKGKTAAVEDWNFVYGEGGADAISVSSGNSHRIYTGAGADKVNINSGRGHLIVNDGGGNDVITVESTAGDSMEIKGYDKAASAETVKIYGGNSHWITLYGGDDTITVSGNGTGYHIFGDEGNDVITVTGGYSHEINGGAENDQITLNNVKGNGNQTSYVYGGDGKDTIIVKNSSDVYVAGENGIGEYTVESSSNVKVQSYGDYGTFTVDSCADTTLRLNSTSGNNVNTVTVSGTGNSVTIEQVTNAKDVITVNWSDSFGKLTIGASRLGASEQYVDTLNIKASMSNFNFYKKDSDLRIVGKSGGEIYIAGFSNYDNWTSFINGINFSDGKVFAYKDFSNLQN